MVRGRALGRGNKKKSTQNRLCPGGPSESALGNRIRSLELPMRIQFATPINERLGPMMAANCSEATLFRPHVGHGCIVLFHCHMSRKSEPSSSFIPPSHLCQLPPRCPSMHLALMFPLPRTSRSSGRTLARGRLF